MAAKGVAPLLALDTSGKRAFVAVRRADGSILEKESEGETSHNEELSCGIVALLKEATLKASDLKAIIIGSGPGSFTGLRIGYSVAKGLAYGLRIPIVEHSSHSAAAMGSGVTEGTIAVLSDARRGEVFFSLYSLAVGTKVGLREIVAPSLVEGKELLSKIAREVGDKKSLCVVGDSELKGLLPDFPWCLPQALARGLLLCQNSELFEQFSIDTITLQEPHYVRTVAAKTIAERALQGGKNFPG